MRDTSNPLASVLLSFLNLNTPSIIWVIKAIAVPPLPHIPSWHGAELGTGRL
jgi:hypothetical protein